MPDEETRAFINPVKVGEMIADISHLKGQADVLHTRVDKLRTDMTDKITEVSKDVQKLDQKVTATSTTMITKLNEIQQTQASRQGFLKGTWRTIAVTAVVIAALVGMVTGMFSCLNGL